MFSTLQTPRILRPRKVQRALGRRRFEFELGRGPIHARGGPQDIGSDYGGWIVPAEVIEPGWRCISVGAGADVSFDRVLVERFGARVWIVEPVEAFVSLATETFAGEPRVTVCRAALTAADGPIRMQVSHDPGSRSVSSAALYETDRYIELPGRALRSLMAEHGLTEIDLFKLDIEGAEYALLPTIDLRALGVKVFSVQLHHNAGVAAARRVLAQLDESGYDLIGIRPAVKMTFLRRDVGR